MNKSIVIFGGSYGLAKDLTLKLCNEFSVINVSSKSTNLYQKNVKEVKLKNYDYEEVSK